MASITTILSTVFLSVFSVVGIRTADEPNYQVLNDYDNIQIRQYPPLLVAQTQVTGDYKTSGKQGFKRLAGYIFGDNQAQQTIEMTTPVMQEQKESEFIEMTTPVLQQHVGDVWTMAFMIPSSYTLATVPKPLDPEVKLTELPSKKVAVLSYTGRLTEANIQEKSTELQTWLSEHHYTPLSPAQSAAYDPPWTVPFLRRNEIHIEIK